MRYYEKCLKATVLIDSITAGNLKHEWGFSLYLEYKDKTFLLDTGASKKFLQNAQMLEIDIQKVDAGILTHAHYDHANGLKYFFEKNQKAQFFISQNASENCYSSRFFTPRYIGIKKGTLEQFKNRFSFVKNPTEIFPGVTIIPHFVKNKSHKTAKQIIKNPSKLPKGTALILQGEYFWQKDQFLHEQSLVIKTSQGLVIFSSCSHIGIVEICNIIQKHFKGEHIFAFVGGLHLFRKNDEQIKKLCKQIANLPVEYFYAGHCTGENAFNLLKEELGERLFKLFPGEIMLF